MQTVKSCVRSGLQDYRSGQGNKLCNQRGMLLHELDISLETELYNYVLENYDSVYENINDAYVERIIDSNKEDIVVEILKNKYQKREEVDIDCSMINTRSELIDAIKHALQYPHFCGDNWDAIEDLIYDIVLPQKLILHNWREVEKKLPQDTAILKSILDKYNNGRCVVIYT